jgi:hypothetical protein
MIHQTVTTNQAAARVQHNDVADGVMTSLQKASPGRITTVRARSANPTFLLNLLQGHNALLVR